MFDILFTKLMEDIGGAPAAASNTAGSGGSLGTFQTSDWKDNPAGTPGKDKYAEGDFRKPVALGARKARGKNKSKMVVMRRPFIGM